MPTCAGLEACRDPGLQLRSARLRHSQQAASTRPACTRSCGMYRPHEMLVPLGHTTGAQRCSCRRGLLGTLACWLRYRRVAVSCCCATALPGCSPTNVRPFVWEIGTSLRLEIRATTASQPHRPHASTLSRRPCPQACGCIASSATTAAALPAHTERLSPALIVQLAEQRPAASFSSTPPSERRMHHALVMPLLSICSTKSRCSSDNTRPFCPPCPVLLVYPPACISCKRLISSNRWNHQSSINATIALCTTFLFDIARVSSVKSFYHPRPPLET